MKKYVLASCFAAVALLISSISIAQTTPKPKSTTKEKSTVKESKKEKMDEYEEIVIKKKVIRMVRLLLKSKTEK